MGLFAIGRGSSSRLRLLSQYWPEFLAALTFAALDGDAVTALLIELPTPSAVRSKTPFEIADLLAAQRYRRRPLECAEQVLAAEQVGSRRQEPVVDRAAELAGGRRQAAPWPAIAGTPCP